MKIEIQIGTEKEKEFRRKEIIIFMDLIGKKIVDQLNIKKIIISSDITKTVNELENTSNYEAKRYMVECQAKIIVKENGEKFIVFSDFWNNMLDQNFRFFFFSHEIYHLVNDVLLPKIKKEFTANYHYLVILRQMFDEYSANRFAIGLFKKPLDENLRNCFEALYDGFFNELQNPDTFYIPLKKEILKFHLRILNLQEYIEKSFVYIEPIYTYLTYIFAYKDSLDFIEKKFSKSKKDLFINNFVFELFKKFKIWFEKNKKIDFEDAIIEIKNFLNTLSIYYEDREKGLYIGVLDINYNK